MPLYMDIHSKVEGATTQAVADAHMLDIGVQGKYGVRYVKYWLDEGSGTIFCLVEAPEQGSSRESTVRRMAWLQTRSTKLRNTHNHPLKGGVMPRPFLVVNFTNQQGENHVENSYLSIVCCLGAHAHDHLPVRSRRNRSHFQSFL